MEVGTLPLVAAPSIELSRQTCWRQQEARGIRDSGLFWWLGGACTEMGCIGKPCRCFLHRLIVYLV